MASKDNHLSIPLMSEDDQFEYWKSPVPSLWPRRLVVANVFLFVVSLMFLLISGTILVTLGKSPSILEQTTFFSIVTDTLRPTWSNDQYRTRPLESPDSVFRQGPSDEVDAEWKRVTDVGVLVLSSEEVRQLGKDPDSVIRAPESWGRGSDARLAHLDGIHLLHCLNAMRKSLYHNFHRYHPQGTSITYQAHLSHCQEALAKHLMCKPSVEMITYNWVKRQEHPFPDFDITRKCWNFESLLEWQNEHRVESMNHKMWKDLQPEVGVHELPIPLLMLEAYNVTREEAELMD